MAAQRVLVAYGTKNGSTGEIGRMIGEAMREKGLDVDVESAGDVQSVEGYDAVVLGGALYAGRWHRDAARFSKRHQAALAGRPVWLFSSGPLDPSASERDIPPAPGASRAAERLRAREHKTFGGRLVEGAKGMIAKQIVKSGRGGDFRDFDQIRAWAHGLADELLAEGTRAADSGGTAAAS